MKEIRALSFKQPYADLIVHNGKIETRTWNTRYRGLVLICSSKVPYFPWQLSDISGQHQKARIYEANGKVHYNCSGHLGMALAIATLTDARPMEPEDVDGCFVEYNPMLYCHFYKDVRRIAPFPWIGCQGWRRLDPEQINLIKPLDCDPVFSKI